MQGAEGGGKGGRRGGADKNWLMIAPRGFAVSDVSRLQVCMAFLEDSFFRWHVAVKSIGKVLSFINFFIKVS